MMYFRKKIENFLSDITNTNMTSSWIVITYSYCSQHWRVPSKSKLRNHCQTLVKPYILGYMTLWQTDMLCRSISG